MHRFPRVVRPLTAFAAVCLLLLFVFILWESPQQAQERDVPNVLPDKFATADSVTRAIRDRSRRTLRVEIRDSADRAKASKMGKVVADYGSFLVLSAPDSESLPVNDLTVTPLETSLNLPGRSFDPIKDTLAADADIPVGEEGYYIVQLGTIATDELLDSLRSTGVEILQYIPNQAFFVYGRGESISLASKHSRVRWAGRYGPENKVSSVLKEQVDASKRGRSTRRGISALQRTGRNTAIFDVAVFDHADLTQAAEKVAAASGGRIHSVVDLPKNFFNIVRIEMPIDAVAVVTEIPEVFSIESWSRPTKEDEVAAQIVAGNYVGNVVDPPGYDPLAQFGANGQGVTVAVGDDGVGIPGDGGFYVTGGNAVNGPLRGASPGALGHGHLQASIIAGDAPFSGFDPNGYNYGVGIAPKSNIVNIPLLRSGYTGTEADAVNDTITTAGPNGIIAYISNNSWGNGTNGNVYDSYAAQYDGFVRDASAAPTIDPLVMVFSAGNNATAGLTRPKMAKNLIAVAATENVRPTLPGLGGSTAPADNLEEVPDFSARGPAADGRVKPDIAAPGAVITGGRSGTDSLDGNIDTYHRVSTGTSHAAPQVAGAAALFTQFWKNTNAGANPSPAMVKAALINGAVDVTGTGATAARPNGAEGWGRVNLKNVLNTGAAITYIDQTSVLSNVGSKRDFTGSVADPARPVRVSLVWTDPPGAGNPALVNDLDLTVIVGGNEYRGNVLTGGSSVIGGSFDNRNNVENVFLPAGVAGPITVRVTSSALNGDGALGNVDTTDQHFALVVFNANVSIEAAPEGGVASVVTGNGLIEPNECNLINIPVTNEGRSMATSVLATLSTSTPGVTVTVPNVTYPDIAPGATQNSLSSFQVSTDNTVACLSTVDLTMTVHFSGGASPAVFNYTFDVGTPPAPNYIFTSSDGATISPGGTLVAGSDVDDGVVNFASPFSFSVYDTSVPAGSSIRLATNGHIRIDPSGSSDHAVTNTTLPSSGANAFPAALPVLLPYWDDLDMRPNITAGGGIYTEVTGVAPDRVLKIEWRARHYFTGQNQGPPDTNFAVYFHENSNQFEYVYGSAGSGVNAGGASATVGVQAATTGSVFTQYSFNAASLSPGLRVSAVRPVGECTSGSGGCIATAAGVTIAGRVVSKGGRVIGNARVTLTAADGSSRTATTNIFGYFRLADVTAGRSYAMTVTATRYRFQPTLLNVDSDLTDLKIGAEN